MNVLIAMAKRRSLVLNAMGQESGLLDFTPTTAKNAVARESAFVLSAMGQVFATIKLTHYPHARWADIMTA
jgi:hypothetical protein